MKRFAVIGAGSFGFYVSKALYENNHEVITIDRNRDRIQAVEPYTTTAIVLDATDAEALKGLGLAEMDSVVVSTGGNISNSILICYHLHELGVKTVIAKVEDETHAEILKKLGASDTIRPAKDTAARLARRLTQEEDYNLVQVDPPKLFIGKSLKEINLRSRYDVYVIAIKELVPERFVIVPSADFVVKDSDILIMIGKTKNLEKIKELK
jgi:trk system potassium uptake protein TrkA